MARFRRATFALGATAATIAALVGCQQLLGLDGYKNCADGECDGGADATPDVLPGDGGQDAGADADADAGPVFPQGSSGSDWITFRIPWVDGGFVDASGFTNPNHFAYEPFPGDYQSMIPVDAGRSAAVLDSATKRTWIVFPGTTLSGTFAGANTTCEALGARVPTRIELVSVLDPTQTGSGGMIRREVLPPGASARRYWSSTAVAAAGGTFKFWVLDAATGTTSLVDATSPVELGVLCVLK